MQAGSRELVTLSNSFAHFDQIHNVLGLILVNFEWIQFTKIKILHFQRWNDIWIPIWELYMWSSLRAKTCSSWAPFSQLRVILGPSLTGLEWRLFGRSGIMGLKIQNNVLIPIWDMQVGSRSLVMLRHSWIPIWEVHTWSRLEEKMCSSWGPFSQLRVILGPSLTSLELLQCCGILWPILINFVLF